ncbi:hypothetical protein FMUND_11017 [Fusarium mundagurra]|uniref:Uncharacterized protein n=1 Tax=Fusarium mundagurra TaxID=1567541 RepID=A0A8H5Y7V8_9HYPO|nr:hypothetical protein FMUND_11017 [Fusarium mundagurra]
MCSFPTYASGHVYAILGITSLFYGGAYSLTTFPKEDSTSCDITGDDDLYGIGIRLSLYLQWATVLIATWIAPNEAFYARTLGNIITIAVLANAIRSIASAESGLVAVEWWIVMSTTFLLQIGNLPFSRHLLAESATSLGLTAVVWVVVIGLNCWVWFTAVEAGAREGCDVIIFLFRPISIYNPSWQLGGRILSALFCVPACLGLVTGVGAIAWSVTRPSPHLGRHASIEQLEADEATKKQSIVGATLSTLLQAALGSIAIASAELTIQKNKIQFGEPLSSSGQTLPFGVALFALCATAFTGFRNIVTVHPALPVGPNLNKRLVNV